MKKYLFIIMFTYLLIGIVSVNNNVLLSVAQAQDIWVHSSKTKEYYIMSESIRIDDNKGNKLYVKSKLVDGTTVYEDNWVFDINTGKFEVSSGEMGNINSSYPGAVIAKKIYDVSMDYIGTNE